MSHAPDQALPQMALRSFLGGTLFAEQREGVGPPLVCLHGWSRDRSDLAPMTAGHDALLVDLPGSGSSPPPPDAWGAAEYAKTIAEMLAEDGRGPYVVVAHSFGGRVGAILAASWPDLVSGVLFCGVPLLRTAPARKPALAFRVARFGRRLGLVSENRMHEMRERYGSADYKAAHGVMRSVLVRVIAEEYGDSLEQIRVPVAFLWGENDRDVPVDVAKRAAAITPNVVGFEVVPGSGHDVAREQPGPARAVLEALLQAVRA